MFACSLAGVSDRPNVMIVVLDTTRADALSVYGNKAPTSPHLEELASGGALFTRAFTTDFWTLPAHASLLTGQYPSEHGATSESNLLGSNATTLAEILQRAGYRTAAFVSNPWMTVERGFAQGFEIFEETWRSKKKPGFADRVGVEAATGFIERNAALDGPFFLFLNLNIAHMPYFPDPSVLDAVAPNPRSVDRMRRLSKLVGTWEYLAGAYDLDERDFEVLRELYLGDLRTTDAFVGELVGALEGQGILDETLVIVTSDHGENLGDHGLIDHMLSMYETTIRVPLVIRYPGRIGPGTVVGDLASLVDIVPTVLDVAGLEIPPTAGRSLVAKASSPPPFVIAENERPVNGIKLLSGGFPDFDTATIDGRMRMLRTDHYKLIWHERGPVELYDLRSDPDELEDL